MTVGNMKKKPTKDGRAADRIRKTLSLPQDLTDSIQAMADEKHAGDFTQSGQATIGLARVYDEQDVVTKRPK